MDQDRCARGHLYTAVPPPFYKHASDGTGERPCGSCNLVNFMRQKDRKTEVVPDVATARADNVDDGVILSNCSLTFTGSGLDELLFTRLGPDPEKWRSSSELSVEDIEGFCVLHKQSFSHTITIATAYLRCPNYARPGAAADRRDEAVQPGGVAHKAADPDGVADKVAAQACVCSAHDAPRCLRCPSGQRPVAAACRRPEEAAQPGSMMSAVDKAAATGGVVDKPAAHRGAAACAGGPRRGAGMELDGQSQPRGRDEQLPGPGRVGGPRAHDDAARRAT